MGTVNQEQPRTLVLREFDNHLLPTSLCGVFVFNLHSRPARPSVRPPPLAPARQPTYTNQLAPSNAHQRTRRATYTNQLPTHIKQCTPTTSPSNVHQPTTNTHQAMHTNKQCKPTNLHQDQRAAKPWQGRTLVCSGGSGARYFGPVGFAWKGGVTSGLKGRET